VFAICYEELTTHDDFNCLISTNFTRNICSVSSQYYFII